MRKEKIIDTIKTMKKFKPSDFEDSLRKTYEQAVAEDKFIVKVEKGWLIELASFVERYEKRPTEENKQLLLDYLSLDSLVKKLSYIYSVKTMMKPEDKKRIEESFDEKELADLKK